MEYVEFVVVDDQAIYDCGNTVPPCVDVRGWIFDDNNGYHGASGVAPGCVRFSQNTFWSCIPIGTIILVYNNGDRNSSIPPDDLSMNDGNCRLVIPINSTLFESNASTPGAVACSYPTTGWVPGGNWSYTLLANPGDCARLVDLSGCEVFSLCNGSANQNNLIYFSGSGAQKVWYFNGNDPYSQSNWSAGCAAGAGCSGNDQTPGAPNNSANAAYIAQFNNGCTSLTPVIASISASTQTGCGCTGTATASASGSIPGYSYAWYDASWNALGQSSATATGLCVGTYHVIATSSIGCSDTASVSITAINTLQFTSVQTEVSCFGGNDGSATVTVTGGTPAYTYQWSPAPGSGQGSASPSGLTAGTYTVQVTDANNCTGSTQVTISEPSEILLSFSPVQHVTVNGGNNGSATANATGGTSPYTYLWDNGQTTATATGLAAGTHCVTITDAHNCTETDCIEITEPDALSLSLTGTPSVSCNGVCDGTINASATGGTAPYSYTWNNGLSGSSQNNLCAGTYEITVSDAAGVSVSETYVINEPAPLIVTASATDVSCAGNNDGTASASASGGTPPYTYTWIPGTHTGSAINGLSAGTYTVEVTDFSGCRATAGTEVFNTDVPPNAGTNGNLAFCPASAPANLFQALGGNPDPGGTWQPALASGNGIFDPALDAAGTYLYTVSGTGACGDASASVTVSVNPLADATITPTGPFCSNDMPVTLQAADPGGTWSASCGSCLQAGTGIFDPQLAGTGLHTVIYTISGDCGNADTLQLSVITHSNATLHAAGPFCISLGDTLLQAVESGGTWSASCGNCIDAVSGNFNTLAAGSGIHTITYSFGGSCPDQQSIMVTVNPPDDVDILPPGSALCENGASIQLVAYPVGGTWNASCGNCLSNTGLFDPSAAGTGTYSVIYTTSGGCGSSDTLSVTVDALPAITFTPDVTSGCNPLTVTYTATTEAGVTNCQWNFGDGQTDNACGITSHTYTNDGCMPVSLSVTSAQGCTNTLTQADLVCVLTSPVADFTFSPESPQVSSPEISFTNFSSNSTSYVWSIEGNTFSTETNPSFLFPVAQSSQLEYRVCLTTVNDNGCLDSTCHEVKFTGEITLYVPNAFTPDGDGRNDIFYPVISGIEPYSYKLRIFNRWGELIFENADPFAGWDGTFRGERAPVDVYVWRVEAMPMGIYDVKEWIGHVTLIR